MMTEEYLQPLQESRLRGEMKAAEICWEMFVLPDIYIYASAHFLPLHIFLLFVICVIQYSM